METPASCSACSNGCIVPMEFEERGRPALAQRIIQRHGGRIWRKEVNEGAPSDSP